MLITTPAQSPYNVFQQEEDLELGLGGAQRCATVTLSYKQLDLLARAVGVLQGDVEPLSFTAVEAAHLMQLRAALQEIPNNNVDNMVHGLCL